MQYSLPLDATDWALDDCWVLLLIEHCCRLYWMLISGTNKDLVEFCPWVILYCKLLIIKPLGLNIFIRGCQGSYNQDEIWLTETAFTANSPYKLHYCSTRFGFIVPYLKHIIWTAVISKTFCNNRPKTGRVYNQMGFSVTKLIGLQTRGVITGEFNQNFTASYCVWRVKAQFGRWSFQGEGGGGGGGGGG